MKMVHTERDNFCWTKGHVGGDQDGYDFHIKHFDNGSEYGIDGGKISKLEMRVGSGFKPYAKIVAHYDRGWDVRVHKQAQAAYEAILAKFN